MKKEELTIALIAKNFKLYKKVYSMNFSPISALAKESGFKPIKLLEFIEENKNHFITKDKQLSKTKAEHCIIAVFEDPSDNPENTIDYLTKKRKFNDKTIKLSYYNNYGQITGYYIEPSKNDLESKYLNTKDKISNLTKKFDLKPAQYYIGGFGDSSLIKPDDSYEISHSQLLELVNDGWKVIGEFKEIKDSVCDLDESKVMKK